MRKLEQCVVWCLSVGSSFVVGMNVQAVVDSRPDQATVYRLMERATRCDTLEVLLAAGREVELSRFEQVRADSIHSTWHLGSDCPMCPWFAHVRSTRRD